MARGDVETAADRWNAALGPYAEDVAALKAVIAELKEHDMLDRAQIIRCDTVSVQLGPKPIAIPPLTPEQEEQKITMPDPEDTLFGASEGIPG